MADDYLQRPRPTVRDLLESDGGEIPWQLEEAPFHDIGLHGVNVSAYTSAEYARAEQAKLWPRVWQMACRADEIAKVGDCVVYEIGDASLIIVRTGADAVRAYHNACLHRGRQLRDCAGSVSEFRCPFHGFTWSLDGSLKSAPTPWDFPHVRTKGFRLPEARTGLWGGFVFVCFDERAPPLETYLEDIPAIFARWPMEDRVTAAHVARPLACNWKVALEAFVESFHVTDTHPQAAAYIGDFNTQYDVWPDKKHYSRMISPRGIASPSQGPLTPDEVLQASEAEGAAVSVPPGSTARREMAKRRRAQLRPLLGDDAEKLTVSEAIDTIQYWIFPNLVCWWGMNAPITYRFRPYGHDPDWCLMEVYLLTPAPKDKPRPAPAKLRLLGAEESWTNAPELGGLGVIFDQDASNLWAVQKGMKRLQSGRTTLARYQENRIRAFHRTLRDYVGDG
ncbi:MAG: aromatic ring-hydroxylating dioxygenase subunit alpha [Hyphomonadaceae bacterium]|nr:aromatic ring-hydroxylating dioxygenase subunit alpha [Hyphomonadaceae bacterium]